MVYEDTRVGALIRRLVEHRILLSTSYWLFIRFGIHLASATASCRSWELSSSCGVYALVLVYAGWCSTHEAVEETYDRVILIIWLFMLGLVFRSFFNVVICHPEEDPGKPGSHCTTAAIA